MMVVMIIMVMMMVMMMMTDCMTDLTPFLRGLEAQGRAFYHPHQTIVLREFVFFVETKLW